MLAKLPATLDRTLMRREIFRNTAVVKPALQNAILMSGAVTASGSKVRIAFGHGFDRKPILGSLG